MSSFSIIRFACVLAFAIVAWPAAWAEARQTVAPAPVPTLMWVEGQLRTTAGDARAGEVVMVVSLYASQLDSQALWAERQLVTLGPNGYYAVAAGATMTDGLPAELLVSAAARWLGIGVEGEPEHQRIMLLNVPYAVKARDSERLGGRTETDFVLRENLSRLLESAMNDKGGPVDSPMPNTAIPDDTQIAGKLTVTGFGTHSFGSAGTGFNIFRLQNTTSGTGNGSQISVGNNTTPDMGVMNAFASNYTTSGAFRADGVALRALNAGGLSVTAEHASGAIRFYTGSTTAERASISNTGTLSVFGFGTHSFGSGGAGFNIFRLQNTTAGTGNGAQISVGNDSTPDMGVFNAFSSTFTSSGPFLQNGVAFRALNAGGLSITAEHGSGAIRFYTGGSTERFRIDAAGNIGIGTASPSAKLHVNGSVVVDGNIGAKYQDVAEWVESPMPLDDGTVVIIDPSAIDRVISSAKAYDTRVAGAISRQPGLVLGEPGATKELVAQSGRVRIKADAAFGAIRIGDLLVTSPTAGHAMRSRTNKLGIHRPGTILGKALEALPNGKGEILVLLTLQ
jgi:hypothetical protein